MDVNTDSMIFLATYIKVGRYLNNIVKSISIGDPYRLNHIDLIVVIHIQTKSETGVIENINLLFVGSNIF